MFFTLMRYTPTVEMVALSMTPRFCVRIVSPLSESPEGPEEAAFTDAKILSCTLKFWSAWAFLMSLSFSSGSWHLLESDLISVETKKTSITVYKSKHKEERGEGGGIPLLRALTCPAIVRAEMRNCCLSPFWQATASLLSSAPIFDVCKPAEGSAAKAADRLLMASATLVMEASKESPLEGAAEIARLERSLRRESKLAPSTFLGVFPVDTLSSCSSMAFNSRASLPLPVDSAPLTAASLASLLRPARASAKEPAADNKVLGS